MNLLGIGQSHLVCIRQAANKHRFELESRGIYIDTVLFNEPRFKPWREKCRDGIDGFKLVEPLYNEIVAKLNKTEFVFSCLGGNAHNILGLVNYPRRFDFVLPEEPNLPLVDGVDIVPVNIVAEALMSGGRAKNTIWYLKALKEITPLQIVHVESPAPISSNDYINSNPSLFAEAINTLGVAPALLRYKLWRLLSNLIRQECKILGIEYLTSEPLTINSEGYLVEKAYANDPVHANPWYGARVIEQLIRLKVPDFAFSEAL